MSGSGPRSRTRTCDALALASLSVFTLALRWNAFAVIHDRGDQLIWAGLARNVAARGEFNVRGIDLGIQELGPAHPNLALLRFHVPASDEKGSLLRGFIESGEGYWDRPLANQPPLFTVVLAGSHALLGREDDEFPLLARSPLAQERYEEVFRNEERRLLAAVAGLGTEAATALRNQIRSIASRERESWKNEWEPKVAREAIENPSAEGVRAQLWATLPPVLSDAATVALVYLAGLSLLRSRRAAIVAALIFAADPLALYASHRLLSNSTLATFSLGAIAAWAAAETKEGKTRTNLLALSGVLAGSAILVKVSAIFLVPAAALACLVSRERKLERGAQLFFLLALAVSCPWLALQWKVLGNPLNLTYLTQDRWPEGSAFGMLVTSRGHGYYASKLAFSPFVFAGIAVALSWIFAFLRERKTGVARARAVAGAFALLVLAAAEAHPGGKEARHLLHVYPVLALAFASGVAAVLARARDVEMPPLVAKALVVAGLAVLLSLEVKTGLDWALDVAHAP